jgi:hypothetical protein
MSLIASRLFVGLLLLLILQQANADELSSLSDHALRVRIAGNWEAGSLMTGGKLVLQNDGTIHGAFPVIGGGRKLKVLVSGAWKVENGKLIAAESLSSGQQIRTVYVILALTTETMIIRNDATDRVSILTRK